MRVKPVLLLDVDGVLNTFAEGWQLRIIRLDDTHAFYPWPHAKPFLSWAWRSFRVYWHTAWGARSANAIARWAGLPPRPQCADPRQGGDYKLRAALSRWGDDPGVPVLWVEDGIGEEAERELAARPWFHYTEVDEKSGLTQAQIDRIADRAGVARLQIREEGQGGGS